MYLSISSSVIPIPWSLIVKVPAFSSSETRTVVSPTSPLKSPWAANVFNFCVASTAFDTISRRKMSWSEYKNFLMTGKMFSVVTPILPFCAIIYLFVVFAIIHIYFNAIFGMCAYPCRKTSLAIIQIACQIEFYILQLPKIWHKLSHIRCITNFPVCSIGVIWANEGIGLCSTSWHSKRLLFVSSYD